jgi:L-iditol 2-dehydrogenase
MLQVKVKRIGEVSYEEVPPPEARAGEAVVKIKAVGICGSDIHVFKGKNPVLKPPVVQGHEFGGIIKSLNTKEPGYFKVGQKVTVNPIINCHKCYYCNNGMDNMCESQKIFDGMLLDGAMKQEIAVPIKNLLPLPDDYDSMYSCLTEPTAVAIHAVDDIQHKSVLIIGTGTIGLCVQQICKINSNYVITMDIDEYSIDRSKDLGADQVLNVSKKDDIETLTNMIKKRKIDVVVDCVNKNNINNLAMDVVRRGGTIITLGVPTGGTSDIDMVKVLLKEIKIIGSYLFTTKQFIMARDYLINDTVNKEKMVSKSFPLNQAVEAYDYKIKNPSQKVILIN